jgi:hypothetical protein
MESLKGRDHSEDLGVDGRINESSGNWKQWGKLIVFIWLRIGTGWGLL